MSSDDEASINDIVSERETQFIPRSDDDEVLWDVQEITAERGKRYKVRWVGIDPATGKPWAQSWVPKHDCTDKLVAEWKTKKRLAEGKKRRRPATMSRTSGSSKRAGSSVSGRKTRSSSSKATPSRPGSAAKSVSPPPKKPPSKRKRQPETPVTTLNGTVEADEQSEPSRPRKKQKSIVEKLLPPISSDDEDALIVPGARPRITSPEVPPKSNGAPLEDSEEEDNSPPKIKGNPVRRSGTRLKSTPVTLRTSGLREGKRLSHSRTKGKPIPRDEEPAIYADAQTTVPRDKEVHPSKTKKKVPPMHESSSEENNDHSEGEVESTISPVKVRPSKAKKKVPPMYESPSEENNDHSEGEVESTIPPVKVGPPRGVRRRKKLRKSNSSIKLGPPCTKSLKDGLGAEHVSGEEPQSHSDNAAAPSVQQADNPILDSPPFHISVPQIFPNPRPHSPELSPGARARLELFDRMMADAPLPGTATSPADVLVECMPDDAHYDHDDAYDAHATFDTFDPPRPLSPPPSISKPKRPKLSTPGGFIVSDTEPSGDSQSQSQSLPKPSPSLQPPPAHDRFQHKLVDLPAIAIIAASAPSSSVSSQDLFPPPQRFPPNTNHPPKKQALKPIAQITPNTFRSTINARSHVTDSEAPPSSIESFTSPKRVDKGKQKAVEDVDQLQSSSPEGVRDSERQKGPMQKVTDSELKKRGKELFNQAQLRREAEWQKKKKTKRLKSVNGIVNGTTSRINGSPLPSTGGAESILGTQLEEVTDLNGGGNSTTLNTLPYSNEERERLRIELRQEEEESTQEATDVYPLPPVKEPDVMERKVQTPLPSQLRKSSPFSGQMDTDHGDQRSADLQKASVIVHPSQGQRQEDMDMDNEPLSADPPASSLPRPIPANLTDSPKRRLGEALSLLNVKSDEIQRLERELADERKNLQDLKIEFAKVQQSPEPTGPVLAAWEAERAQWARERSSWENDRLLWQTQSKEMSEEKANLTTHVAELSDTADRAQEAEAKLSELEVERTARTKELDTMRGDMTRQSEELVVLTKIREEYGQDRSKWEIERTSWVEERARWEAERTALQEKQEALSRSVGELTAKVESTTAARISAEKDRDFFREQYAQASQFVDTVREENMELEKKAKIAEGQAQEGVAAIKAFSEGRIKALQADVDRWKRLSELLQEKDRRTNDELRLRAAQTPELAERCSHLDAENKTLKGDVRKLALIQQRSIVKQRKLYHETFALKRERASLKSKLAKTADIGTQDVSHMVSTPPIPREPESMDPNDMEILLDPMTQSSGASSDELVLFPCMWRPQWRDQCQHTFDTKEDLERHLQEHFRALSTR